MQNIYIDSTKRYAALFLSCLFGLLGLFGLTIEYARAETDVTTVVLYDGALGGLPESQQLSYLGIGATVFDPSQVIYSASNGVTTHDSTPAIVDKAGYFDLGGYASELSRTVGFRLTFDVQLVSENHINNNRAGFNVILLGDDKQGVELAFWENEIWVQTDNPLFRHGEGNRAVNPTAALTRYTLDVRGDSYTLTSGSNVILTGSVRDYTAATGSFAFVYNTPNMIFLGDNTTSADSKFKLAYVSVSQGIPEAAPNAVELTQVDANAVAMYGLLASFAMLLSATVLLWRY